MDLSKILNKYPALKRIANWKSQMAWALIHHDALLEQVKSWTNHSNLLSKIKFSFDALIEGCGYDVVDIQGKALKYTILNVL